MTILDEFRRDDARVLDRLVDGELSQAERRALLAALDDEPGGWRRCALAFLEAQSWRWQLAKLSTEPLESFHTYAFATLRQFGAAFELAAEYLRWLERHGEAGLTPAAGRCDAIAASAKTLQFKTARIVSTKKPFDATPILDGMVASWDDVMSDLMGRYGA